MSHAEEGGGDVIDLEALTSQGKGADPPIITTQDGNEGEGEGEGEGGNEGEGEGVAAGEAEAVAKEEEADPFHIGNVLLVMSGKLGNIVGRVTYRSLTMVRITPNESSSTAIELPLMEDGTGFVPELEISEVEVIETQISDYYVDTLGARVGEHLEFFKADGSVAEPPGIITAVTKTPTEDSITLEDGRVFQFAGEGPQDPVAVIRVTTGVNAPAAEEGASAGTVTEGSNEEVVAAVAEGEGGPEFDIFALLQSVMPSAAVETVPMAEMRFSDSIQREDMFQDLLKDLKPRQRTNPRRIRFLEREVDLSVALKNKVLRRGSAGQIEGVIKTSVDTLGEALAMNKHPLPAAIPIVAAARVLNLDFVGAAQFKTSDVAPRVLTNVETASIMAFDLYEEGAEENRDFYAYTYANLSRDQQTLVSNAGSSSGSGSSGWGEDQDVIRTAGYDAPVQGLSHNLPKADTEGKMVGASTSQLIYNVHDRSIRVLKEEYSIMPKTGKRTLIGSSDPSTLRGYVILPLKAALKLRPPTQFGDLPSALIYSASLQDDNLPTIAAVLTQLYSLEPKKKQPWTLSIDAAADFQVAEWLHSVLPHTVHPADALGGRTSPLLNTMDTLGLNIMDLSAPVATVIREFVNKCQEDWRSQLNIRRKAIQQFLDAEPERTFQSVTGTDSPLWSDAEGSLVRTPALAELLGDIRRRNPTIAGSPTLLTASFLMEAQGDATPLVAAAIATIDARPLPVDPEVAADGLARSRAYALRRKALQDLELLRLTAAPERNGCPHVTKLEAIRNIRDDLERSRLLREFVELYQGGDSGSWMTCALCTEPCVCYHELLELEAMSQPARLETIKKQIMIQFGGERYQGKIVCKNCGQPLRDIDYDDGPEYDDEGNVILSRSVLTEEQLRENPEESILTQTIREMVRPVVEFTAPSQRDLAAALDLIAERAGVEMETSVVRQIVRYADLYVNARKPSPEAYEAQRRKALTSASAKIKTTGAGAGGSTMAMPTYEAVLDNLRVSALGALMVLALQTADPPVTVNNPFPICPFSRAGWPMDDTAEADPMKAGALQYITCIIATIDRDEAPWSNLLWSVLPTIEARKKKVGAALISPIKVFLGIDEKGASLSVTTEIRSAMQRSKSDVEALKSMALVSQKDRLPNRFRPEPFPVSIKHPVIEGAIQLTGPTVEARKALEQEAGAILVEMHEEGSQTVSIQQAGAGALQHPSNNEKIALIQKVFSAGSQEDTRLWPSFTTPIPRPVEQTADPAAAYKLFLKFCYYGPAVGEPHEFSFGDACRQCGFQLGRPLDLVDIAAEGAGILEAQKGPLQVAVTEESFAALSNAVRRHKLLTAPEPVEVPEWRTGLLEFAAALGKIPAFQEITEHLNTILARPELDTVTDELERSVIWSPLTIHMDELLADITERVGPIKAGGQRGSQAAAAMATFLSVTEDPFLQGPRVLQEYWTAKAMAAATATKIMTAKGSKWFRISKQHSELIDKILKENADWFSEGMRDATKGALRIVAMSLGPALRAWLLSVKPAPLTFVNGWTVTEAQILLRSLVYQVWRDAVSSTSPLWTSLASSSAVDGAAQVANWTRELMLHVKKQYVRYSKDRIQQVLQQIADLDRESIVKEFRDSKDNDLLGAMLFMKQQGIGRWGIQATTKKYDADLFEFEATQREAQGRGAEPPVDPANGDIAGAGAEAPVINDYGVMGGPAVEEGYNMAQGDDDEGEDAGFTAC